MVQEIILVRHGLSEYNKQGRMQGSSDFSRLSDVGQQMANRVGESLIGEDLGVALASPLARAKQTAERILSAYADDSVSLKLLSKLRETDMYQFEGMKFTDIEIEFPTQFSNWKHDPINFCLESEGRQVFPIRDLYDRSMGFWQWDLPKYEYEKVLLVSHGGTIQALINSGLGLDVSHHHSGQQSNCGINRLQFDSRSNEYVLTQLNNTAPLEKRLPKLKAGKQGLRIVIIPGDADLSTDELLGLSGLSAAEQVFNFHQNSAHDFQNLIATYSKDCSSLTTVILTGPILRLQEVLSSEVGLRSELANKVRLENRCITSIHYSASHPTPILQCVNFPGM